MGDLFHDIAAAARFGPEKMTKVNLFESSRMFCDLYCLEPGQVQKDRMREIATDELGRTEDGPG